MPKVVDREQRRREIAAALWRVAYRDGWSAVSLRNVAAEASSSLGAVQHYFSGNDDLIHYAVARVRDILHDRLEGQLTALRTSNDPEESVCAVLQSMIPGYGSTGDESAAGENAERHWRVQVLAWLALAGRAVQKPELGSNLIEGSTQLAQAIAAAICSAVPRRAEADSRRDAAGLLAMVEGIMVQLAYGLIDPRTAGQIVEQHVARILSSHDE